MLVSVIIPAYNSEKYISYALNSCLLNIDYLLEIVVVDDFSTDSTWDIINEFYEKYPTIIKAYKNINKGGNNARNLGFKMSCGKYIQWLDADDVILVDKWPKQISIFNANPKIDIVYSDWILRSVGENFIKNEFNKEQVCFDFLLKLLEDKWLPPHCYLIKRESAIILDKYNAWNPKTVVLQDREYFTTAALLRMNFYYAEGCFAIYYRRLNQFSVSKVSITRRYESLFKIMLTIQTIITKKNLTFLNKDHLDLIHTNASVAYVNLETEKDFQIKISNINWGYTFGNWNKIKILICYFKQFFN